jgi:hypothetical protein
LLLANGTEQLTVSANGSFSFVAELESGNAYSVTIATQPANPTRICTLINGAGTVASADVVDVTVTCTGPLELLSTATVDGEENVSRSVQPLLNFSADLDPATVAPTNVVLSSTAGQQSLGVSVAGPALTVAPSNVLLPLTEYTLTVDNGIRGTQGERSLDPWVMSFKTRDGVWSTPENLEGMGNGGPRIAFDDAGNAYTVFTRANNGRPDLWGRRYLRNGGWQPAELVYSDAQGPVIGIDGAGNLIVAWIHFDATNEVWARRHLAATNTWEPAVMISAPGIPASSLDIDVHSSGDAIVAWQDLDGTTTYVRANYYDAGAGWSTPVTVNPSNRYANRGDVGFSADGSATLAWAQYDGNAGREIRASRYVPQSGWGMPELISVGLNGTSGDVHVAVDADGDAMAAWVQDNGLEEDVYTSYFTPGSGWMTPAKVDTETGDTDYPKLAFDLNGEVIAVWRQIVPNPTRPFMYSSRFTAAGGWGTPQQISSFGSAFYPELGIDPSGHALVVWYELDVSLGSNGYQVWSNRYTAGTGWTTAERIGGTTTRISTFEPRLAVDRRGNAFAIWSLFVTGIWVSRFE